MEIVRAKEYLEFIPECLEISESDEIEKYTNVWGEQVLKIKKEKIIINPNSNKPVTKIALGGHVFMEGYYNIDEDGNEVYCFENPDEFYRIGKTVKLIEIVNEDFLDKDFSLGIGPNNTVVINDVQIVPDCYWELPKKDDELENNSQVIINKVRAFMDVDVDVDSDVDVTDQDVKYLEECIVAAVCNLDLEYLSKLEEIPLYSHQFKYELIIDFSKFFKKLLIDGVRELEVKKSKCHYCYPDLNAYSFYSKEKGGFVVRYVIGKHPKFDMFVVEECRNKPISNVFFDL